MSIAERVRKFLELVDQAVSIRDSAVSWETKYNLIYSDEISVELRKLGFNYCAVYTSHEEDVRAYVDALVGEVAELRKVLTELDKAKVPPASFKC